MKVSIYNNQKGEKTGQAELPEGVFGVAANIDLLRQVVISQMANRRQGNAHAKDRSEVSGGGRKPWKQKGTGRARHGSNRSPIWVGGGVSFGPRNEKNYKKEIPSKMRKKALLMALSGKAKANQIIIIENFSVQGEKPKTKQIADFVKKLPCYNENCLVVLAKMDKNLILSLRNIKNIETMQAKDLNALDVLSFKYILMPQESVEVVGKTFAK